MDYTITQLVLTKMNPFNLKISLRIISYRKTKIIFLELPMNTNTYHWLTNSTADYVFLSR
ncbi:protein of unknown function [Brevefilum fermentans]|uniref:Uncharacterized protein n=1 Tax=Candidatus Brevifilum fermentans TaxID=1986204 RepID=A0A1Y6K4C6_9CHLR|nr:protein of unknown function [Brevefilum fermentans]